MPIADSNPMSDRPKLAGSETKPNSTNAPGDHTVKESPTVVRGSNSSIPQHPASSVRSGTGSGVGATEVFPLPQPGQLIDCFELEEVIGIGGMGAVFRARDTKLDREVALKLVPQAQSDDPEVVKRFYQEGRSAARLDHENIARVHTIGRDGPYHFIAFEYIEGETLRRRVETQGPLSVGDAINFTLQIAAALVHASERGVVHRDIKPSNIIITPRGKAKLVDMGLARQFERQEDRGLTQSGMTLGTFDYISPEQARDPRDVDVRSDLYSLGCTLFHMLAGRPPFVGGTVLQKLLQHQEEKPPDIREYNANVSPELAAVMAKLMAKDPDRRYQTPEQLVRDLLVLGASADVDLGESFSLHKPGSGQTDFPSWVGHLVWALPILAFAIVISGLVWWGRELNGPASVSPPLVAYKSGSLPRATNGSEVADNSNSEEDLGGYDEISPEGRNPIVSSPRNLTVTSAEDLLTKLETAPSRSIISLSDSGPYRISRRDKPRKGGFRLKNRDLTIRADAGTRPVVMAAPASQTDDTPAAILDFEGGRITIEGLEFVIDGNDQRSPSSAIRSDGTELTLRRCTLRTTGENGTRELVGLRIRSTGGTSSGDRIPAVHADQSHFGGNPAAIATEGPVDVVLRHCTLASVGPNLSIDNGLPSASPAQFYLTHASLMTGRGPVFRVKGEARFWVDDCVIAPAGRETSTTLISANDPRLVLWRGRANLYANIGTFLESSTPDSQTPPVTDFAKWVETDSEVREVRSRINEDGIWKLPDPLQAIARAAEHPSQSFLLSASEAEPHNSDSVVGARQGPLGLLVRDISQRLLASRDRAKQVGAGKREAASGTQSQREATTPNNNQVAPVKEEETASNGAESAFLPPRPMPAVSEEAERQQEDLANQVKSATASASPMPPMPPMPSGLDIANSGPQDSASVAEASTDKQETKVSNAIPADPNAKPSSVEVVNRGASSKNAATPEIGPKSPQTREVRNTDEFLGAVAEMGSEGGVIRLVRGADLDLPSTVLNGAGSWRFESGGRSTTGHRPQIRFSPDHGVINKAPLQWSILFSLKTGKFQFQGLDFVIPSLENLWDDRVAAFGLGPNAELKLEDCSVTLVGNHENLAAVVALPGPDPVAFRSPDAPARVAKIEVVGSFIRSGGDFLSMPRTPVAGIEISIVNSLLISDGSVIHARGGTGRAPGDRNTEKPRLLQLDLERVTVRAKQSLVRLESSQDEPELPVAKIVADDSIICLTNPEDYLLRVDGHDQPVVALRDNISWKGNHVAYYQIMNYRRDQNGKTGSFPKIYNRQAWANTVTDNEPVYDQFQFEKWDASLPAWMMTQDDLRPATNSLKGRANLGADLKLIPTPPRVD